MTETNEVVWTALKLLTFLKSQVQMCLHAYSYTCACTVDVHVQVHAYPPKSISNLPAME